MECNEKIRIQKVLARAGIASRRQCEKLIDEGRVQVNDKIIKKQGIKICPIHDEIFVDGKHIELNYKKITLMLNKPAGYLSAMCDYRGKRCVSKLVPYDKNPNLFHVGRLDFDTTGLLLFTTDGELAQSVLHPKTEISKTYLAAVKERPSDTRLEILRKGVELEDGITSPAKVNILEGNEKLAALYSFDFRNKDASGLAKGYSVNELESSCILEVKIHEGRNRQIRRMFSAIAHPILALHRKAISKLELGDVKRGTFRELNSEDISKLIR